MKNLCDSCTMKIRGECGIPDHPAGRKLRRGEAVTVCAFFQTPKGRRSLQEGGSRASR